MKTIKYMLMVLSFLVSTMVYAKGAPGVKSDFVFEPLSIYQEIEPGKTITQPVKVYNTTDQALVGQLLVEPAYIDPEGVMSTLEKFKTNKRVSKEMPFLGAKSFSFASQGVEIPSKKAVIIPLTITVPKDASGSYYFLYSIKQVAIPMSATGTESKLKSGSFGFKMNIRSPGAINVKGKQSHSLKLEKTSVKYSKKSKSLNVLTNLVNDGNSYLQDIEGFAVIISEKNEVLAKIELRSSKANSLRNNLVSTGKKQLFGNIETSLKTGKYSAVFTFRDQDNKIVKNITEKFEVK